MGCTYHLWMITRRAFSPLAFHSQPSTLEISMLVANYVTSAPTLMAIGMFSVYHIYCMMTNSTTIEGWEKDRVATLKRRGKIRDVRFLVSLFIFSLSLIFYRIQFKYPYDLGILRNTKSVLGNNILFWCLPQKIQGTGLRYEVGINIGKSSEWDDAIELYSRDEGERRSVNDYV